MLTKYSMRFFTFILALMVGTPPLLANDSDGFRPKVRSFSNKERPQSSLEHESESSEEARQPRRREVGSDTSLPTERDGHPLGESLVFPKGYRPSVSNW
ncbi:hypothetical protein EBT16_08210 [bacterium]|nr:hypothetical protein [bacterium]